MNSLADEPARVTRVHIDGLNRTGDHVVRKIVSQLFQVRTAKDLLLNCEQPRMQLLSLDAFRSVEISIDTDKGNFG